MEIISKISKGSKMDQVYLPKKRHGFSIGSYVVIMPLEIQKEAEKPYYYNLPSLEPIKVNIINEIFALFSKSCTYDNIIITGSFLEKGFHFNDVDVLLITEIKHGVQEMCKRIQEQLGVHVHIIVMSINDLLKGLATDPLYSLMFSSCVAKKRFIYKPEREINYNLLDIHLLKSKTLINNYELLDGNEKWYLTRNMICILLFLENKKINNATLEKETQKLLGISVKDIKRNVISKLFVKNYKTIYAKTFNKIMEHIHDTKQK